MSVVLGREGGYKPAGVRSLRAEGIWRALVRMLSFLALPGGQLRIDCIDRHPEEGSNLRGVFSSSDKVCAAPLAPLRRPWPATRGRGRPRSGPRRCAVPVAPPCEAAGGQPRGQGSFGSLTVASNGTFVDVRPHHDAARPDVGTGVDAGAEIFRQNECHLFVEQRQLQLDKPDDVELGSIATACKTTDHLRPSPYVFSAPWNCDEIQLAHLRFPLLRISNSWSNSDEFSFGNCRANTAAVSLTCRGADLPNRISNVVRVASAAF